MYKWTLQHTLCIRERTDALMFWSFGTFFVCHVACSSEFESDGEWYFDFYPNGFECPKDADGNDDKAKVICIYMKIYQ